MATHAHQHDHGGIKTVERAVPGTREWQRMHADHLARYLFAAGMCKGKRVLDAGTGPGYGAAILHEAGAHEVIAVDIDAATIEQASRAYPLPRLKYLVDDCHTLERVSGPFDVICNFENIEHLPHPERFLHQAARLLAPDGVLLCSTPDRDGPYEPWKNGKPNNPFHITEWYADEFRDMLLRHFEDVNVLAQAMSYAAVQRAKAAQGLVEHLDYLWANPLLRLQRAVTRLLGRRVTWPSLAGLDVPGVDDFPIVSRAVLSATGIPFCHYAICRSSRREVAGLVHVFGRGQVGRQHASGSADRR